MTATRRQLALWAFAVGCGSFGTRNDPAISSLTPSTGPAQGGTMVTIAGTNLTDESGTPIVLVGTTQATVALASSTQITFALPAGVPESTVDVTVSDAHGFITDPGAFTYNPLPQLLAISPAGGPATGGTTITITGRGFSDFDAGTVSVTIGSAAATNVQVASDQMLTATTGAQPASVPPFQPLDIVLGDANGSATLPRAFSTTKQGLLMMSRFFPPTLSYFDPTTTDTTTLGVMSQRMHGCALGSDGTLYATGRDTVTNVGTLYSFDPLSGSATTIGQTIDAGNATQYFISSLVFVGPTLYGFVDGPCCSSPIKRLVTLDLGTGSATLVGASAVTAVTTRGPVVGFRDANSVWCTRRPRRGRARHAGAEHLGAVDRTAAQRRQRRVGAVARHPRRDPVPARGR